MRTPLTILAVFFSTPLAQAATCYQSAPLAVNGVAKPAVISLLWPDRDDEVGEINVKAAKLKAATTISCTTDQPVRCQLEGDLGSITLLARGQDLTVITRSNQLTVDKDDGGESRVRVTPASSHEYALRMLSPDACTKLFGPRRSIVVFPNQ